LLKQYKVNNLIITPTLRLIGEDGKQIGVMGRDEALDYALGQGFDLVLISETANPPVARIIDFKKFLYQESKKEAESKKAQKNSGTKELRLGSPFVGQGDIATRVERAQEFLKDGFKVKIVVKFVGRQITHPEFGHRIMNQIIETLKECSKVDRESKFEGKLLTMVLAPSK
jgi:translation initiation factor IF-3